MESYFNDDNNEMKKEWKPPMALVAAKRPDGMYGRIRLLKRGLEKGTRIPYALTPNAIFIPSGPY